MAKKLHDFLIEQGYFEVRQVEGRGYCALMRMMFTIGLFVGMDKYGYLGRYCYPDLRSALDAMREWDGMNDPPGPWIKYKGMGGDRINPRYSERYNVDGIIKEAISKSA